MRNEQLKKQEFIGVINGMEIRSEREYNTMCYIMDNLSLNFEDVEVKGEFIAELAGAVRKVLLVNETLDIS